MGKLILLMFAIPLFEVWLLLRVGDVIGGWPTIGAVIATAVIGGMLVRRQGVTTLNRVQQQMNQGQVPAAEMFDGVCILLAGALLITPGFFTDFIGFLCLWPQGRRAFLGKLIQEGVIRVATTGPAAQGNPFEQANTGTHSQQQGHQQGQYRRPPQPGETHSDDGVLEGEFRREE